MALQPSDWVGGSAGLQPAVLEAILGSLHRTHNAAEADFFYVPVLGGCLTARTGDSPRYSRPDHNVCSAPYLTHARQAIQLTYMWGNE